MPKRLELLSDLVPQVRAIALLVNPNNPQTERVMPDVLEAAQAKGLQLSVLKASSESEIDTAFTALVERHAGALVVQADPVFLNRRDQLTVRVTISLRNCAPAARSRATSPGRSSTTRWMRFQPPASGRAPSAMGRPAELVGPLSSSRSDPSVTSANAGV
jgi:hypothetical protein